MGSDFLSNFLIILQSPAYYNTVNILSFAETTSEWCKLVKIDRELLNETLRKCQEWRAWFHNILDVVQTVKMGTLWSSSVKWPESGLYCFKVLITNEPIVWSLVISTICRGKQLDKLQRASLYSNSTCPLIEDLERWLQVFWLRYLMYEVGF